MFLPFQNRVLAHSFSPANVVRVLKVVEDLLRVAQDHSGVGAGALAGEICLPPKSANYAIEARPATVAAVAVAEVPVSFRCR